MKLTDFQYLFTKHLLLPVRVRHIWQMCLEKSPSANQFRKIEECSLSLYAVVVVTSNENRCL